MQIKTQKQITILQNKAQKVADQLNKEIVAVAKGIQHIQVQAGMAYQLSAKEFDVKKLNLIAKKNGNDLEVALEENVIIFDNYFAVCETGLSCLVSLPTEDGGLYHIVANTFFTLEDGTQVVYFYGEQSIVTTESSAVSANNNQSFKDIITSNIEIVVAVVAVAIIASNGNDGNKTLEQPIIQVTEVNATKNEAQDENQITVKAEPGSKITITFSANEKTVTKIIESASGNYDKVSVLTVDELNTLGDGSISISAVAVKDGVISSTGTGSFTLDTVAPIFDQQPTTINTNISTPITTTIYDAQATDQNGNADEGITYSIKGTNANKFEITADTGKVTYKEIQTSVHSNDTVTIIATDTAGNTTEQIVTVSVVPPQGFVINGENAEDVSGHSVSSAGDVNGDGLDDLIIGAPHHLDLSTPNAKYTSKSYVVFGKTNATAVNLSDIASGIGGFVINGKDAGDYSGFSTSSAGDVNGDGLDDLIVGANYSTTPAGKNQAGRSFVVFGKINTTAVDLSNMGMGGFVINGENAGDRSGVSVSSAGDVNGDGLDDLIIGASTASTDSIALLGNSYVVFGKANATAIDLSNIAAGTGGFIIRGINAWEFSGTSVSSAGDVNGDGLDDLIVGSHGALTSAGRSFVVFGKKDDTNTVNLSDIISGTGGFVINGENAESQSGWSVSSIDDINGDGLDDLIIGAHSANNTGKSYVVFGKANTDAIDLSDIAAGTGGFVINGEGAEDDSSFSVSSAGDVNGDGLDDLIVGAPKADPTGGTNAGKSYVIFGKTSTKSVYLTDISKGEGVAIHVIDFQGDTNADKNDTLTGTSADELFVAGLGNDVLRGNGGTDVFNAGAGDDIIIINNDNLAKLSNNTLGSHLLARVDGGGGTDTLKLEGGNLNLDLSNINNGRIQDIEIIDLTGSGNNTLKLNLNDLLDFSSSTNVLKVIGNSGDKIDIELNDNAFVQNSASKTENGINYHIYSNANASTAELWIDQTLEVI